MFCSFYLVKNHKIANNSTTTKAREKIGTYLEFLVFYNLFDVCLTKFKNKVFLIELSTDSWQQLRYILGERTLLRLMYTGEVCT